MEADLVFVSRLDENSYLRLTHRTTRKGKPGRAVWEFTDDFHEATGFRHSDDVNNLFSQHRVHTLFVKARAYGIALTHYLQHATNAKPRPASGSDALPGFSSNGTSQDTQP